MSDNILICFKPKLNRQLRERVKGDPRSLNRFINDAVRWYLDPGRHDGAARAARDGDDHDHDHERDGDRPDARRRRDDESDRVRDREVRG